MLTIGARMKQRRKELGLSLEQVSDVVKIRKVYLEALEEGNYDVFDSAIYTKGFLKNYAVFLGIEPNRALALYRRECEEKQEKGLEASQKPINEPKFVITPGKVIFTVLAVMIIAVFGYFYYQYQQFATPPFLDIRSPKDGTETLEDAVTIDGSTEIGSIVTINDQAIKTDDLGNFRVTVSLREGSNRLKVASENGIGKKSEKYVNVFLKTDSTVASGETPEETPSTETETPEEVVYSGVEMEVTIGPDSAWLLVETDGETAFTGVLVADTIKTFSASEKIYIKTGNAGSTNIKINGVTQEPLGSEGDVESREYTVNSVSNTDSSTNANPESVQ